MFFSIQFLRVIAALAVVLFHTNGALQAYFHSESAFDWIYSRGGYGVDVFFVISGFIISYMVCERKQNRTDFLINRVARIVPPYWLLTVLTFALVNSMPVLFRTLSANGTDLLGSLTFLSWTQDRFPILNVGWTLSYEIFFYITILMFYRFVLTLGWREIAVGIAVIGLSPLVYRGLDDNKGLNLFFFLEFFAGMVAFLAFRRRLSIAVSLLLFALMVLCSILWQEPRITNGLFLGLFSLAAVLYIESVRPSFFNKRLILELGDGSYAIYLLETFTIPAAAKMIGRLNFAHADVVFMIAAPILTCGSGVLFYRLVETQLISFVRSALQRLRRFAGG